MNILSEAQQRQGVSFKNIKSWPMIRFLFLILSGSISIFLFIALVLDFHFDIHIPILYNGDTLWQMAVIKSLAQGEWHLYSFPQSQFLGAPYSMNMADFPLTENIHFLLIKWISIFSKDPAVLYNSFYLLGYGLATITFIFASDQFRIPKPIAVALGILFALLPYHFMRYTHLILSSYFLIPLLGMVIVWMWSRKPIFHRFQNGKFLFSLANKKAIFTLVIAFLTGTSGTYFAFFSIFFTICATMSSYFFRRNKFHIITGIIIAGTIIFSSLLSILPNQIYIHKFGKNPAMVQRNHIEAEIYGLKLKNILTPSGSHRIPKLAKIRGKYSVSNTPIEGQNEPIGLIATIGFFILLSRIVVIRKMSSSLDKLSSLLISGILFASVGGFAVLFAAAVTPKIRCYNRISVYIAFFSLFAIGFVIKGIENRLTKFQLILVSLLILGVGIFDQATPDLSGALASYYPIYKSDQQFIQKIESQIPADSAILQLPFMPFPEGPPIHQMESYSHFIGYLHSTHLKWSFGTVSGRPESAQIQNLSQFPLNIHKIKQMGYSGIFIFRDAFADKGLAIEKSLEEKLGTHFLVSENQKLSFIQLL